MPDDRANVLEYAEPENREEELRRAVAAAAAGAIFVALAWTGLADRYGRGWWVVPWVFTGMIVSAALWTGRERKSGRTAMERCLVSVATVLLIGGGIGGGLTAAAIRSRGCAHPAWMQLNGDIRALSFGLKAYALDHGGRYPAQLDDLLVGKPRTYFESAALARLTDLTPPATAQAARVASGPMACWYLGDGESEWSPPGTAIFVERTWRNGGVSAYVVTADGRPNYLEGKDAMAVLRQVATGTRPVLWPPPKIATTRPVASLSFTGNRNSP